MKKLLAALILFSSCYLNAQLSTVSATITDATGQVFANGTYKAELVPAFGFNNTIRTDTGLPVSPTQFNGTLSSAGAFSGLSLTRTDFIGPAGAKWKFTVCPDATSGCFDYSTAITLASVDLTGALSVASGTITVTTSYVKNIIPTAYSDSELNGMTKGSLYYNTTSKCLKAYDGIQWVCNSGNGINILANCANVKGDGVTDDAAAINACFTANPGQWFVFPQTKPGGACSYFVGATLFPKGEGARITGSGSGFKNSNTTSAGTVVCSPQGVTPYWLDMTPNSTAGITTEHISFQGSSSVTSLGSPTLLNISGDLPQYTRNLTSSQRVGGTITIVATSIGQEGIPQQVGSTVLLTNMPDSTMNGRVIITSLTGLNTFGENATGFTASQNGADTILFGAVGQMKLPTTGAFSDDGARICSNFNKFEDVAFVNFSRHGINADMQAGHGCTTLFSDDLILDNVVMKGNQGNGFYCQGVDCNAGTMTANTAYYNVLYGIEDHSSLGNNWLGNQISNNGSAWATTATPATKTINTISRTLVSGVSTVTVVLSVADVNLKQGSCVVIAGVTDATFNTATPPAGTATQCFNITSFTDSTHFQYEQPGAPADAASSGGTERMAKFSEVYLSDGLQSGAVKVGTQVQTYSQPWVGNYVEGGQDCKFGVQVIVIGGANMPTCATLSTFKPASILGTTPGIVGSSLQISGFSNERDQTNSVFFKAGLSGGTTRHTFFRWYNNNLSSDAWGLDVDPTGASATNGTWRLSRGTAGSGVARLSFFGATNANGITRIDSESVGAVQINLDSNSGTGGLTVCSGGASPTCPTSPSIGSDFGHFGPYFKSSTASPASAGIVRGAKTDQICFRNNANSADICISLSASDTIVVPGFNLSIGTPDWSNTTTNNCTTCNLKSTSIVATDVNTVGKTLRVSISGNVANNSGVNHTYEVRVKIDSTDICVGASSVAIVTGLTTPWSAVCNIGVVTTGAGGTIRTGGSFTWATGSGPFNSTTGTIALDTTTTHTITTYLVDTAASATSVVNQWAQTTERIF